MREEKKMIRKKLHDFEDNFFRQNGRYVCVSLFFLIPSSLIPHSRPPLCLCPICEVFPKLHSPCNQVLGFIVPRDPQGFSVTLWDLYVYLRWNASHTERRTCTESADTQNRSVTFASQRKQVAWNWISDCQHWVFSQETRGRRMITGELTPV